MKLPSSYPVSVTITPTSIVYVALIALAVWLVFFLKDLVLIVLTAIVIASAIEPAVLWFMKYRIIRPLAVSLVYLLVFGTFFGGAYFLFPPLISDLSNVVRTLPQYFETFEVPTIVPATLVTQTTHDGESGVLATLQQFQDLFTTGGEGAFLAISAVFGGVVSFLLIIVLSFYFAIQETGIDDFIRIVSPIKHQKYLVSLWRRAQMKIGLWMQGQLLLSLIVAVLTYLWLSILGVPYALLLAIFAAVAELVPVFGSLVAAVPATLVGLSTGGITLALLVAGGYLIINQIQGNLIYPLVVKRIVGVPPLLVILALIAGTQLAGFLGALLAVPVAAALQEFIADIQDARKEEYERERLAEKKKSDG